MNTLQTFHDPQCFQNGTPAVAHNIAGRRWNTSADPINQSKRCPVRGISQNARKCKTAPRYRLTPPQKKTMPDGYETPSEHQRRPQRMSGCRCTQSRVDVGTPTQTPTHGYPEIDPRTHQFSRVRAPVEKNMAAPTNKNGGAH